MKGISKFCTNCVLEAQFANSHISSFANLLIFLIFFANNAKISQPNSLLLQKIQPLNNQLFSLLPLSKTAWSYLGATLETYRRMSEG